MWTVPYLGTKAVNLAYSNGALTSSQYLITTFPFKSKTWLIVFFYQIFAVPIESFCQAGKVTVSLSLE